MDLLEADKILDDQVRKLKEIPYPELKHLIDDRVVQTSEANSASGGRYYLEIQALWDTVPGANIRVIAAIDDGGKRAYRPLTRDFIKAPDGSLLDEAASPDA